MSSRFTLNQADLKSWLSNALIFLAPLAIVFLTALQNKVDLQQALYLVYMYGLGEAIALLKKFVEGKPA